MSLDDHSSYKNFMEMFVFLKITIMYLQSTSGEVWYTFFGIFRNKE